jgi:hypothetical protein
MAKYLAGSPGKEALTLAGSEFTSLLVAPSPAARREITRIR